jgi:hypothetical protein
MHIPEVDESDLVILSQQGNVVVASPDAFFEVASGFLDVVIELRDLRLVHADAWQFLFYLFPSENLSGTLVLRACGIGDNEY